MRSEQRNGDLIIPLPNKIKSYRLEKENEGNFLAFKEKEKEKEKCLG